MNQPHHRLHEIWVKHGRLQESVPFQVPNNQELGVWVLTTVVQVLVEYMTTGYLDPC